MRKGSTARLTNYMPIPECGCWIWLGSWGSNGYGRTGGSDGARPIHRVFYEEFVGPIPQGMIVCHKCDTPTCVNPDHLFLGSHIDNMRDMAMKNRGRDAAGEMNSSAKLKEWQVLEIYAASRPQKDLAKAFGVSVTAIGNIKQGTKWRHVTRHDPSTNRVGGRRRYGDGRG